MIEQLPKYESYKDSGNDWFGSIPTHWDIKKLSHVFQNIGSGTTPSTSISSNYIPEVNWLQTGDLNDGIIVKTSKKISCSAYKNHSTLKLYPAGSLVIAMYGATIGKLGLLNIETTTNQACCVLSGSRSVLPKYFFYCFLGFRKEIISLGYGGGQPNISQEVIRSLRLPFPTIDEQERICIYLDSYSKKIDEAIAIKQKQIELLKERKQIIIQQAVTQGLNPDAPMKDSGVDWIGQIPEHWGGVRFKNLFTQSRLPVRKGDGVVTSYRDGQVTLRSNRRVGGYTEAILEGGYQGIRKGQLVLNSMDAFEGAIGVSDSDGKCTPEYVICDPINSVNVSQYYFAYLLREMALAKYIQVICNAVRQRAVRIRYSNLAPLFMVVPPIKEQEDIVSFIEKESAQLDAGTKHLNEQISKLKEYKATLINSAVTGKIKVMELK
ncbi:TPA: restriction endonuclease subunit S [Vibrio parahaemolyticus]|nr:restriction endonuclease subunit S [Vibrio parahaemolyticus]